MLQQHQKNRLINRIISSIQIIYVDDNVYSAHKPDLSLQILAEEKYQHVKDSCLYLGFYTDEEAKIQLIKNGLWSFDGDSKLKDISKRIEDLKVELYKSFLTPSTVERTRKELRMVEDKYMDMLARRHSLDHLTINGFASFIKKRYLIANTLYINNTRLWPSYDDSNPILLDKIMSSLESSNISISEYRELSRSEPWRSMWSSNNNMFNGVLTEEQQMLIMFTKMYDNAYGHSECPPDKIIEDDDMFDGWLIKNRRRAEKDRMDTYLQERGLGTGKAKGDKIAQAQEVYIPAKSKEEIKQIHGMNDFGTTMVRKQREVVLKKEGKIQEGNMPDQRQEIQRQRNELFKQQVKRK